MFLGDSAIYGMMKWEDSLPGIFQKISKINVLNGGVPSYSPTVYLNRYKEALKSELLNKNHILIIGLDISDVQDEAGYWMDPNYMNLYDVDHPINLAAFKKEEKKANQTSDINTIKDWVITHLNTTTIVYRIVKFNIISNNDYTKPLFYSSRSAFTWQDFNQLEKSEATEGDNYTKGYLPLGVEGGIKKIKIKISEINKLVHENNGNGIYLLIYPWPAQIHHEDKFKWSDYVNELCLEINCLGTVDLMTDLRNYAGANDDWYTKFFLNGDIHLNKYANKIFAEKIWREIKN